MELLTDIGKLKKFYLTTRNVRCVIRGAYTRQLEYHIDVSRVTCSVHIEHL